MASINNFDVPPGFTAYAADRLDHHLRSINSSLGNQGMNYENGFMVNSQTLASNYSNNLGSPQNGGLMVPHRGHGAGQIGLSQRLTEVRKTYVTPYGVRVHSIIDYCPAPNHFNGFPPCDDGQAFVTTEISTTTTTANTKLLNSASTTRDHVLPPTFIPNNTFPVRGKPNFQKGQYNFTLPNQMNTQEPEEPVFFENPYFQSWARKNPSKIKVVDLVGNGEPSHVRVKVADGVTPQNPNMFGVRSIPINAIPIRRTKASDHGHDHDDHNNSSNDGRTHSLSRQKYGPYICPKCNGVFEISQTFASHMLSHYKDESREERKKRLAAKYRKKNLRLAVSHGGLTLVPQATSSRGWKRIRTEEGAGTSAGIMSGENGVQVGGGGADGSSNEGSSNVHVGVMIKKEPK